MIRFACPACGAKVAAPDQLAGRKPPCKRCGETIRVPAEPPLMIMPDPNAILAPTPDPVKVPFEMRMLTWAILTGIGLAICLATAVGGYYFVYRPFVLIPPLFERRALYEKYHGYVVNYSSETETATTANCNQCNEESIRRFGRVAEDFRGLPQSCSAGLLLGEGQSASG